MGLIIDPGQVLEIEMGVDLGGGKMLVAEKLLDPAEVAA